MRTLSITADKGKQRAPVFQKIRRYPDHPAHCCRPDRRRLFRQLPGWGALEQFSSSASATDPEVIPSRHSSELSNYNSDKNSSSVGHAHSHANVVAHSNLDANSNGNRDSASNEYPNAHADVDPHVNAFSDSGSVTNAFGNAYSVSYSNRGPLSTGSRVRSL